MAELLAHETFADQGWFDAWRGLYNLERPHQALGLKPPIGRYQPSSRLFPESLLVIESGPMTTCVKYRTKANPAIKGASEKSARHFVGTQDFTAYQSR